MKAFSKKNYIASEAEVIKLIKRTHPKWKATEGFIADGIVCPDIYEKQQLKIMVVLGESYGYDECGCTDIETPVEKQDVLGIKDSKRQTPRKITTLLWLLFQSLEKNKKLSLDEFLYLFSSEESLIKKLQDTILKIAWINVKKTSRHIDKYGNNATRQNYQEIYSHSSKNKAILQKQFDSIVPNLIIVCSNPVFNSLFDMGLLGEKILKGKKDVLQTNEQNQKIMQVDHPSYYRTWGHKGIFKKYKSIYKGL